MTDEYENAIEFLDSQKTATVTLHSKRLRNRILKLAEQYPDEVAIIARPDDRGQHGYLFAHVPVAWLKVIPPKVVTEAMRENGRRLYRNLRSVESEPEKIAPKTRDNEEKV